MLTLTSLIIFQVGFFTDKPTYISRRGLEYAVQDIIEEHNLRADEQEELRKLLEFNPSSLLSPDSRYFHKLKYAILPFLRT